MKHLKPLVLFSLLLGLTSCGGDKQPIANSPQAEQTQKDDKQDDANDASTEGCPEGFAGKACDHCAKGFFGDECEPCYCQHGTCNGGKNGDGMCLFCDEGWDFKNPSIKQCDECADGYYGENCTKCDSCGEHGSCKDKKAGDGSCECESPWGGDACTECAEGFSGKNCEDCAEGYYGSSCTKCPVCNKENECHGTCKSGKTGEGLVCDWGYEISTGCTTCTNGFKLITVEPGYPPRCVIPCNSDADCPNVECVMSVSPYYCKKYSE